MTTFEHVPDHMGPADWAVVRAQLGIPQGWTLRPRRHAGGRSLTTGRGTSGYWTLTATAGRRAGVALRSLPCGHRSMQVTATALPLAVARLAGRLRFHQRECR